MSLIVRLDLRAIDSTTIAGIGRVGNTLLVRFRTGALYSYESVPQGIIDAMLRHSSKGKFLAECIVPFFKSERIEERA
jgi:glutamine amidotransferase-like uncharacterized protein